MLFLCQGLPAVGRLRRPGDKHFDDLRHPARRQTDGGIRTSAASFEQPIRTSRTRYL